MRLERYFIHKEIMIAINSKFCYYHTRYFTCTEVISLDSYINHAKADSSHANIPFWSWNDKLEEAELRRQIRNMKQMGMRGFFMHARGGLETEYMSDEWFDCVRVCIDEAKKQDMEAWAYDENGWPSGFAGGELLKNPENHAAFLVCEKSFDFPAISEDLLGVYSVTDDGVTRLTAPIDGMEYTIIRRGRDFSYVDVLNPNIAKQFIEKTHAVYQNKIGDDFGKAMPGFFTDEPQYYSHGTPWSDTFRTTFSKRFGYDVLEGLPALFFDYAGAEEFRYDYHLFLHECYMQNFAKPIYDWCDENGIQLTGHCIEEWGLTSQMKWCGGIMPFYQYQHIPGIDYLGRGLKSVTGVKQLSSVCEQIGRTVRLTETFAGCGWDISPLALKRIADLQFAGGVNMICDHLYPYSERGQRKRDYPNHYSEHSPWQAEYKEFIAHYSHLGSLLSHGRELADTLVIHPIHSAYLHYKHQGPHGIMELNTKYRELADQLTFDQIPFHYGDETIMKDLGEVEGATIRIGNCRYNKVIIPFCYTLDSSTVAFLRQYLANGGKLYLWDGRPDRVDGRKADLSFLISNITYEELKADTPVTVTDENGSVPIWMQVRVTDAGRILYFANPSESSYLNTKISVKNCKGLTLLDPLTLKRENLRGQRNPDGSVTVLHDFEESASCLLLEEPTDFLPFTLTEKQPEIVLDPIVTLTELPENIMLLDEAAISLNGEDFSGPIPIEQIRDNLLRQKFEGNVTLKFAFHAEFEPDKLIVVAEPMRYKQITVNGNEITLCAEYGRFDRQFLGADIAPYTVKGANTIQMTFPYYQREEVYRVLYGGGSETLRNCLSFDTEIENVYLYGNFAVTSFSGFTDQDNPNIYRSKGPFVLAEQTRKLNLSDIVPNGYPFFAGRMTVESSFTYCSGDPTVLHLTGHYAVCQALINGKAVDSSLFTRKFNLAPYVKEGENTLQLTVCFSNRNLLGPHHREDAEPAFTGPKAFSFENEWDGDSCPAFVTELSFIKFGVTTMGNM